MLSDSDIYRAAHLMLHQYGDDAELEAAQCADRMLRRDDREETLTWFRIWDGICPRNRFAPDSPLEETRFEPSVVPGRYTAKIPDTL